MSHPAENTCEVLPLCDVLDCLLQAYQPLIQVSILQYSAVHRNTISIVYYSTPQYHLNCILQYSTVPSPLYTTVFYSTRCHLHCILKYSTVYHNTISTVCCNAITGITYTGGNIRPVPQPQWDRTTDIAQESYGLLVTHPGKVS